MAQKSFVGGLQGYLEKNSGLMKAKTKFWCCLESHVMEIFKSDKKVYVLESIDLKDAQTVRKVNSDKTGVQFEIIMKKNKRHVFTALTANECSTWIKELQSLMIAQPVADISRFDRLSMGDTGPYSSIDDLGNSGADNSAQTVSDLTAKADAAKCSSDYAEIEDFPLQSNARNQNHSTETSTAASQEDDDGEVVIRRSKNIDFSSQYAEIKEADVYSEATRGQAITEEKHKDLYATVNKKPKTSEKVEEIADEVFDVFDNLNDTKPVPLIPLTDDDYKPLCEMKQFLDNNKEMCRYSYTIVQPDEDPIEQVKEILKDIR